MKLSYTLTPRYAKGDSDISLAWCYFRGCGFGHTILRGPGLGALLCRAPPLGVLAYRSVIDFYLILSKFVQELKHSTLGSGRSGWQYFAHCRLYHTQLADALNLALLVSMILDVGSNLVERYGM